MIITSDIRVTYRGNGQTIEFPFAFPFYDADYICVKIKDELTGLVTKLDADYFVDTNTNTVIYPGYPPGEEPPQSQQPPILPETSTITIYRNTEISQLIDLGSKYPLPIIEQALDKITEILQELKDNVDRSVKVDETSTETPDMYLQEIRTSTARAVESKIAAAASEAAALASQQAAATSATAAAASEAAALASQQAAATSATAAAASEAAAAQSATDLETAVTTATTKAAEALASQQAAATSETNAANSASAAATSQQAAAASATAATASAANASNSASAAAGSATEAANTAASIDHHAGYRQASTAYSAGVMATHHALPYGWYLECTTPGITDSGDITLPSPIVENATVTDGTVVWTIRAVASTADIPAPVDISGKANVSLNNLSAAGLAKIQQYGGGIISKNLATNGYVKFENGLIIQWGTYTGPGRVTISLPISFTNTNYKVVSNMYLLAAAGGNYIYSANVKAKNKGNFDIFIYNTSSADTKTDWVAIGY